MGRRRDRKIRVRFHASRRAQERAPQDDGEVCGAFQSSVSSEAIKLFFLAAFLIVFAVLVMKQIFASFQKITAKHEHPLRKLALRHSVILNSTGFCGFND